MENGNSAEQEGDVAHPSTGMSAYTLKMYEEYSYERT
jgi:hypothetical protein